MTTRAAGPPAYVAAHRIAVLDKRLPFDQAHCLARLVYEHGGGPFPAERSGQMGLKLFKALAAEGLVNLDVTVNDPVPVIVRLRVPPTMVDTFEEFSGRTITVWAKPRGKSAVWYAEATQEGLDLVAGQPASG